MRHVELFVHFAALESFGKRDLPWRLSLAVAGKLRTLRGFLEVLDAQRVTLLQKFAELDASGHPKQEKGFVVLKDPAGFQAAWGEMQQAEVEDVPAMKRLDLSALPENFVVPPAELAALMGLGLLDE